MDSSALTPMLWLWALILFLLICVQMRRPSCGLVISYCFQMWMFYWLGGLIHALPWSDLPDTDLVVLGFQQATWGIAAFAVGAVLAGAAIGKAMLAKSARGRPSDGFDAAMDPATARRYIMIGAISYFILAPTIGRVRGLAAVSATGEQLVVSGCCLQAWMAWNRSGKAGLLRVLPQTILIPVVVLLKQGFMSYGVLAISTIMIFVSQFFRPRWILAIGAGICGYMGLTFYVSYMRDRDDLRSVIWAGNSSLSERLQTAWHTTTTLDAFDARNPDHLMYIDGRLNQDTLVGTAVENLSTTGAFNNGSTIVDALVAMVPRLFWPSKPVAAGSGSMVAKLTGLEFASGTSVGVGPVLEFYGNFGTTGVLLGFLFFGTLVGALDFCAGAHMRMGNWAMFTSLFLVGISCLNVSGSLVEVTAGVMASMAVAALVRRLERKRERSALLTPRPIGAAAQ